MKSSATSISEFVRSIKDLLEGEFKTCHLIGEISNLSFSSAGHYYFTLSDSDASVRCILFKGDALRNPLIKSISDGSQIIITGSLGVYQKRGEFQVLIKRIYPAGEGDLKAQFEKLKEKFQKLGYFDHKKIIPSFPKRIALITAPHGAALQDFLNIMYRRSLFLDILIIPALVQGEKSEESLVLAINTAKKIKDIEVIVLTRGGGSIEDLWSFNGEKLVEAIHHSSIPVVSAVGHQVDFTLSDFVSDLRCETPSAAAEILSEPHIVSKKRMDNFMKSLLSYAKEGLLVYEKRIQKIHPRQFLNLFHLLFKKFNNKLFELKPRDKNFSSLYLNESTFRLNELERRMEEAINLKINNQKNFLNIMDRTLLGLNPKSILKRGYSFIKDDQGIFIKSKEDFDKNNNENFSVTFFDGEVHLKRGVK